MPQPNQRENTELHNAACEGDDNVLLELLRAGESVNARNSDRQTPLHQAARNNRSATIRHLLAAGGDASSVDCHGQTPLMVALMNNQWDAVVELVRQGAAPDVNNVAGVPLLCQAVGQGANVDVLRCLLDRGANANRPDPFGDTPLHVAVNQPTLILETLVEAGADLEKRNGFGYTPLGKALTKVPDLTVAVPNVNRLLQYGASLKNVCDERHAWDVIPSHQAALLDVVLMAQAQREKQAMMHALPSRKERTGELKRL